MEDMLMEIAPHEGIGDVCLGMPRAEAERLRVRMMRVAYAGSPPVAAFIEVHSSTAARYRTGHRS